MLRALVGMVQEDGSGRQLITPPLDGTILPGVTRDSILHLARQWRDCEVCEAPISVSALRKVRSHPLASYQELCLHEKRRYPLRLQHAPGAAVARLRCL